MCRRQSSRGSASGWSRIAICARASRTGRKAACGPGAGCTPFAARTKPPGLPGATPRRSPGCSFGSPGAAYVARAGGSATQRADGTDAFLRELGVRELEPLTAPFDPGYDPVTLEAHLDQSAHLMSSLKLSMASWLVADERATRRKLAAARAHGVPVTTGGGPFEVAVAQGRLEPYLDLCGELGFSRIEC